MKKIYLISSLAIFFLIAAGISYFFIRDTSVQLPENMSLTTQNGDSYTISEDLTSLKLVEFIYTHCPDICPTTTQKMVQLKSDLEKDGYFGKDIKFITITIDPYSDRPVMLQNYMKGFEIENTENWTFLTGDKENIKEDQKKIREIAESLQFQYKDPGNGQYVHTSFTYLIDQNNKYVAEFPMGEEFDKKDVYETIVDEIN